jgi:hypothetical protein
MSLLEIIALLTASCIAGMMNAVAGGGTLITFPILILFGIPPIIANATNTLVQVIGITGSLYGFRESIQEVRSWFKIFIPVSLVGGVLGSYLLTHGSESIFTHLVPYLVLFATLLFMMQGMVKKWVVHQMVLEHPAGSTRTHLLVTIFFQFFVSLYGGYFGAGIGILMLASLGFLGFTSIHRMNALKCVLGFLINLVAALWFTIHGLINWPVMAIMTVGALAGYYFGATYSQRLSQERVRHLIAAIGLIITVVMFWKLH